ncbi:MAG: hypothetical protein RBS80_09265 [Thermoguttaceae bacterium]|jgi:hypothetical protein|nr:hypothetical protein [Thermoguttaceae bacterium]
MLPVVGERFFAGEEHVVQVDRAAFGILAVAVTVGVMVPFDHDEPVEVVVVVLRVRLPALVVEVGNDVLLPAQRVELVPASASLAILDLVLGHWHRANDKVRSDPRWLW